MNVKIGLMGLLMLSSVGIAAAQSMQGTGVGGTHEVCRRVKVPNPSTVSHQTVDPSSGAATSAQLGAAQAGGRDLDAATSGATSGSGYGSESVGQNRMTPPTTYHYEERCRDTQQQQQ
ncbi:hypothetical protein [Dyella sp. 2HG41-7]|uniref:hypothetical protein n=1 Tax=Dyella sp. 2HG41-7 TaxID=2883239 RepID=UPI001F2BCB03|nr:hypothetical protein [Dyella sp. 2HG41-7]